MKTLRRTKIVCTLGPATDRDNNLEKIIKAGANVVRMNFSHGTPEDHMERANRVREIAKKLGVTVAILGDLQGPKIRVSTFKDGKIFLKVGDKFVLDAQLAKGEGSQESVGIDYKELPNDVHEGDILLLDDGRVQLRVLKTEGAKVYTEVTVGGPLSNNKGINKLGGGLSAEALTDKDKADILTAAKIDVDYLAVSFPRNGDDMRYARTLAEKAGLNAKLVAKVERAEAVATDESLDDIILASDVVMVARGDLGVEIGDAQLVAVQKKLILRARQLNRVIITATQMMESMIQNPMPTRAEVMDVANAVLDGTDAVMLSAETAAGAYPEETVKAMVSVCLGAEKMRITQTSHHRIEKSFENIEETTAMSAMYTANHQQGIAAVVGMTHSGSTVRYMSRIRSGIPIYGVSRNEKSLRLMALYRGVYPIHWDKEDVNVDDFKPQSVVTYLTTKEILKSGDVVVVTHGTSETKSNTSAIIKVK